MANDHTSHVRELASTKPLRAEIDVGLRQFLLAVYNYIGSGLALTGLVAYGAGALVPLRPPRDPRWWPARSA